MDLITNKIQKIAEKSEKIIENSKNHNFQNITPN